MSQPVSHHPETSKLMSFAAGSLPEPLAAAYAAHASMCAACRGELRDMELMGAALLCSAVPTSGDAAGSIPARPLSADRAAAPARHDASDRLPAPIARHYGLSFDSVRWKRLGPGIWHHRLTLSPGVQGDLRLLKIAAGRQMPLHGHGGMEVTLVLDGAYRDATGEYRRGDIQDLDDATEHSPVADPGAGCICLIASERPARFKGIISRLVQPWTGM